MKLEINQGYTMMHGQPIIKIYYHKVLSLSSRKQKKWASFTTNSFTNFEIKININYIKKFSSYRAVNTLVYAA